MIFLWLKSRAGVLVPFFEYSYSKPSVLGKYSLGCVLNNRLKKQLNTRVLCLTAKQVVEQH